MLTVSCANAKCGFLFKKELCATLEHHIPAFNDQSLFSARKTCPECNSQGWLKLIPGHGVPLSTSTSSISQPAAIMLLRTSGLTPLSLSFGRQAAWSMTTGELVDVDMSGRKFFRHDGDKYLRVKDIHGVVSKVRSQNIKGTDGKRSSRGAHCRSCNRNFKTEGGLQDHNQAKHADENQTVVSTTSLLNDAAVTFIGAKSFKQIKLA
ncbi:UPF0587 protein [Tanacetum coccineum]